MTNVSNLDNLANAISSSSAKIKTYAQAQAAATQSPGVGTLIGGTETKISSDFTTIPAAGDDFGISCIGSTISGWYRPAAGSWTLIGSVVDTAVTGTGYIGWWTDSTDKAWVFDDFGGGNASALQVPQQVPPRKFGPF
jgi:hypothetical protein